MNPYFKLTRSVKFLLVANFAVFLIQHISDRFLGGNFIGVFGLVPAGFVLDFRLWQIVTYAFLHGDVMHLFLNLLMLLFIGGELESAWGTKRFLKFYFFCSTCAGIAYLLMQAVIIGGSGMFVPMVGASGAIYGLLMAYGLVFGERVLLFMLLFPMKAKHFVWILAGVEFMTTLFSPGGGLSSVAHLAGMGAGFLYLWGRATWRARKALQGLMPGRKRRRRKPRKGDPDLRLVVSNESPDFDEGDPDRDDPEGPTWH